MLYQAFAAEGFDWLNLATQDEYGLFLVLDGSPVLAQWQTVIAGRRPPRLGQVVQASDFPWLASYALMLNEKAMGVFSQQLAKNGELLPVITENGERLFAYNAPLCDVLDYGNCEIRYQADGKTVMRVKRYAFLPEIASAPLVFRVGLRAGPLFYQESFVSRYQEAGLRGLDFEAV